MARRRYISPQFWESPTATRVGPGARLLLIGCWTLADDEGILLWDSDHLRELLFSHDSEVTAPYVSDWMNELVTTDAVLPYTAGKHPQRYGYLIGFESEHRTGRPKPSAFPAPPWERERRIIHAYIKRDGYCCYLCSGPVFWSDDSSGVRVDTHDLDGSLDHLRDRRDGGTEHPSNIRTAHVACRQARSAEQSGDTCASTTFRLVEAASRSHYHHLTGTLFNGVPTPSLTPSSAPSPSQSKPASEVADRPADDHNFSIARLTEPSNAGLTTHSVSPALPSSLNVREDSVSHPIGALTCENSTSSATHDTFSEDVVSLSGALIADSPTEREREKELEREKEPLSASRSCTAEGGAAGAPSGSQNEPSKTSACGAAKTTDTNEEKPHPPPTPTPHLNDNASTGGSVLSAADVVLDEHHHVTQPAPHLTPATVEGDPVMSDETQDSLFAVPDDMVKEPETKKKRKEPSTWTPDRKEQAHAILKPWWANYGDGFPQNYGVVFGVIVSVLANKVSAEDIERALNLLGPERKPISGGTIAFALSKTTRQVAEETAYEAAAASRSADKYTQRTM